MSPCPYEIFVSVDFTNLFDLLAQISDSIPLSVNKRDRSRKLRIRTRQVDASPLSVKIRHKLPCNARIATTAAEPQHKMRRAFAGRKSLLAVTGGMCQ
jgi:hypothetical protein